MGQERESRDRGTETEAARKRTRERMEGGAGRGDDGHQDGEPRIFLQRRGISSGPGGCLWKSQMWGPGEGLVRG